MSKNKKIVIGIISVFICLVLLFYFTAGFLCDKPGMNGFTVTNGMIHMLITNKDYVKVGENRYLYRDGNLQKLIENEYDSFRFIEPHLEYLSESTIIHESTMIKAAVVSKNGIELKGATNGVWSFLGDYSAIYYKPY